MLKGWIGGIRLKEKFALGFLTQETERIKIVINWVKGGGEYSRFGTKIWNWGP